MLAHALGFKLQLWNVLSKIPMVNTFCRELYDFKFRMNSTVLGQAALKDRPSFHGD